MGTTGNHWIDRRALDKAGELIGVVVDVYDDPGSHQPTWLAISTGFFGTRIAVAPLLGASLLGDDVVIAHTHEAIAGAPRVEVSVSVEAGQQRQLLEHYAATSSIEPFTPQRKQT